MKIRRENDKTNTLWNQIVGFLIANTLYLVFGYYECDSTNQMTVCEGPTCLIYYYFTLMLNQSVASTGECTAAETNLQFSALKCNSVSRPLLPRIHPTLTNIV